MRELFSKRFAKRPTDVFAELAVMEGEKSLFKCFTVELPWRNNEREKSCVPAGRYKIVWEYSPKFARNLWELKGVPGRSEVKLHAANRASQLDGCIAPGGAIVQDALGWAVSDSSAALNRIHELLSGLTETYITIADAWDASTVLAA